MCLKQTKTKCCMTQFYGGCCLLIKSFFHSLQEFEDLDEITARYIQPMASFARDLLGHKYFQECHGGSKEVYTDCLSLQHHIISEYLVVL